MMLSDIELSALGVADRRLGPAKLFALPVAIITSSDSLGQELQTFQQALLAELSLASG